MGQPLAFNADVAAQLERMYVTRDAVRRRDAVKGALAARPGERILDIGCGPGFYVADLLDAVGPRGEVAGVDTSPAMLAMTAARVADSLRAELADADATALPFADGRFDAALSVQVLEYVPDVDAALVEIARVLRPGGRVVLWDVDWSTLSLHSLDAGRTERMLRMWDLHLHDPALPRTLGARMAAAGFTDVAMKPHVFATRELTAEAYGGALVSVIAHYATTGGEADPAEVGAWVDEMHALHADGRYFCVVTQFCFTGVRP